ncbi:hypothetical protein BXZ70DRAFT_960699 [Cristinia sonorae]|uniref:Uncharacterized protein n=1 Tax=Cristinia sonorae TaxID=1940300 RepID=A0A8K0XK65_9AGAR|nr:hypothetical protein BXZ70DRAFT_960699 [Cristinia sonorae]
MMSTHAFALPLDGGVDISSINYMDVRTPGKAPFKTPGRTLHKSRSALQENAGYDGNGGTTVKKGKGGTGHTPFHPAIRKALQSAHKPTVVVARPLGDKTPAPNRHQSFQPMQTPAPNTIKMAKLSIVEAAEEDFMMPTPGAHLRPSSMRKSLRAPRTSGSGQKMMQFKTPATNGRHWEVNEEDMQLEMAEAEEEAVEVEVDDYDEIEYMPPKVPEQPYEPPFEMPDYKTMGKALVARVWTDPVDDTLELKYARPIDQDIDVNELLEASGASTWEKPKLAELSDDEEPFQAFLPAKPSAPVNPSKTLPTRPGPSRPIGPSTSTGRPLVRSATISGAPRTLPSRVPSASSKPSTTQPALPRTTSNTPAPQSTSSTTATTAVKRPMTSTGIRHTPPVTKAATLPPSKTPAVRPASADPSASKRPTTAARPAPPPATTTLVRSRSVAGKAPTTTTVKPMTRTTTAPGPGPITRTRSATVVSTTTRPVVGAAKKATPAQAKSLFKLVDAEQEDFVFDV